MADQQSVLMCFEDSQYFPLRWSMRQESMLLSSGKIPVKPVPTRRGEAETGVVLWIRAGRV